MNEKGLPESRRKALSRLALVCSLGRRTRHWSPAFLFFLVLPLLGFDDCEEGGAEIPKRAALDAIGDAAAYDDLCHLAGAVVGCDLCELNGWYEDGLCDQMFVTQGLCEGPEPDCENTTIPDSLPADMPGDDDDDQGDDDDDQEDLTP